MSSQSRYATVVFDVDSTLSALEGIDWLATCRGPEVAARVAAQTDRAMRGEIALDAVYGERLALVHPSRSDIELLVAAYRGAVVPGAAETIGRLQERGVRVIAVSGGLWEAVAPFAVSLGIAESDVHAVRVRFDASGGYAGFETASPLATADGKRRLVESLSLDRPIVAVGDGMTDLAMRGAVDLFVAFTGVVRRDAVADAADAEIDALPSLCTLVLE